MKRYAPILLRLTMSAVFLWFGYHQLADAVGWSGFLPSWTETLPISQVTFVQINGWFEVIFGLALLAGFHTRFVALLLSLHLLGIAFSLGYSALAVRDFGLACATLSIFLNGFDDWSVDKKLG